jgi:hypothetical protein
VTATIARDLTGGGTTDQTETHAVNGVGASVITLSDLNADGSLKDQTVTTVSADGLTKSIQTDSTGDGVFEQTESDVIVADAGRQSDRDHPGSQCQRFRARQHGEGHQCRR